MAEITQFDTVTSSNQGAWFPVPDPVTGEDTDFELLVKGARSDKFRSRIQAMQREREKAVRQGRPYVDVDGDIDTLVEITDDWRGLTSNGEPVAFSKDVLRDFYKKSPDTRAAVFIFIEGVANFKKG